MHSPEVSKQRVHPRRVAAAGLQRSSHAEHGATAHENVILSGPTPDLPQSDQDSEESREARHGDSSLDARRHGSRLTNPLRVTAGVIFRTSNLAPEVTKQERTNPSFLRTQVDSDEATSFSSPGDCFVAKGAPRNDCHCLLVDQDLLFCQQMRPRRAVCGGIRCRRLAVVGGEGSVARGHVVEPHL
jgi:hypothetical protein